MPYKQGSGQVEFKLIGLLLLIFMGALLTVTLLRVGYDSSSGTGKGFRNGKSHYSLQELYGRDNWPRNPGGPSNLLVLSYHNSGAPLMTRILMLMGAFAGYSSELNLDADRSEGWELEEVARLNTVVMTKNCRPGLPLWMAAGFNTSSIGSFDHDYYMDRMQGVKRYLNAKQPWVLQDNKMAWLAHLWMERLENPLCVIMYRNPSDLAQELSQVYLDGISPESSYQLHLERWTASMLQSFQACNGVPTLIFPYQLLMPPYVEPGVALLFTHLQMAGMQSIWLPTYRQLEDRYEKPFGIYKPNPSTDQALSQNLSADFSSIQINEDWLGSFLDSEVSSSSSSSSSRSKVSEDLQANMPVEAVVMKAILRAHLRDVLPIPKQTHKYSTVAGELHRDYQHKLKEVTDRLSQSSKHGWLFHRS